MDEWYRIKQQKEKLLIWNVTSLSLFWQWSELLLLNGNSYKGHRDEILALAVMLRACTWNNLHRKTVLTGACWLFFISVSLILVAIIWCAPIAHGTFVVELHYHSSNRQAYTAFWKHFPWPVVLSWIDTVLLNHRQSWCTLFLSFTHFLVLCHHLQVMCICCTQNAFKSDRYWRANLSTNFDGDIFFPYKYFFWHIFLKMSILLESTVCFICGWIFRIVSAGIWIMEHFRESSDILYVIIIASFVRVLLSLKCRSTEYERNGSL